MWRLHLAVFLAGIFGGTQTCFAQITIASRIPGVIPIDKNGAGSITLTFYNPTTAALPFQPSVRDLIHDDGVSKYSLNNLSNLAPATDGDKTKVSNGQLASHGTVEFKLTVTQVWEAGEATAELWNDLGNIGEVKAIRIPSAYNMQLDPSSSTVLIAPDSQGLVTILNTDPMNYLCSWELVTRGNVSPDERHQESVIIPANGAARINLTRAAPKATWLGAGTLKDDLVDSALVLHPVLGAEAPPQAPKILPLKLRLRRFSTLYQEFWEFFWTLVCLLIGALASLVARYFIPNALGAIQLRRDLWGLNTTCDGMSDKVDSRWRVLLAYNIDTCRAGLGDFPWAFPAFASRLSELQTQAAMIGEWVNIAYRVGTVLDESSELLQAGDMPPSVLDLIERACQNALEPVESGRTDADELEAMKAALKSAQDLVAALRSHGPIPVLEQIIQEREKRLQANNAIPNLINAFPVFSGLLTQAQTNLNSAMSAATYVDRDLLSRKAELLLDYYLLGVRFGAGAVAIAVGGAPAPVSPALKRLEDAFPRWEGYLTPDSILTLQKADLFLREMRQDYYTAKLYEAAALTPAPGIAIHANPSPAENGVPVHFSLRFVRDELNDIAAIQEWGCDWNFDDGSRVERGWDTYHRFTTAGTHKVSVTIIDLQQGKSVPTSKPVEKELTITASPAVKRNSFHLPKLTPEAKIEAAHLAIVLAVAFFGLFATARGQIENLTTFSAAAVLIGVGFGADTLKNLIAQKGPEKPAQ